MRLVQLLSDLWTSTILLILALVIFFTFYVLVRCSFFLLDWFRPGFIDFGSLWAGLPLGFIGIVAGYLTALSRAPAVSTLVPAALTLVGGVVLFLIERERDKALPVGFAIVTFSFTLLLGTLMGATARENYVAEQQSLEYLKRQADEEFVLHRYRKGFGLPPYPTGTSD